jgi:hypothetical protein
MIRKLLAAVLTVAALTIGTTIPADAARPQPDPASFTAVSFFYRCGDYRHGPVVRGWLVRTRWGYAHVTVEPVRPVVAECLR